MKTFQYTIKDPQGIHARPAGDLVKKATQFQSSIMLEKDGKQADAKRIFAIMSLAAKMGDSITFTIEGEDEEMAMNEIEKLMTSQF